MITRRHQDMSAKLPVTLQTRDQSMRKNERKHTEKNLKKTGKTEKTNLQNRRESSKLEVLAENGRESPKPYGNFQKRPRCQKTTAIS